MKKCTRCKIAKPIEAFSKDKTRGDGLAFWCRKCASAYRRLPHVMARNRAQLKVKYAADPAPILSRNRRDKMRKLYGITPEDKESLLLFQGGRCAVCRLALASSREANIDHDHASGQVRGLLCRPCNQALGLAKEDPWTLRSMADYVMTNGITAQWQIKLDEQRRTLKARGAKVLTWEDRA